MTDLIRRADAIEAVRKLKIVEDNKNFPDYAYNAGIETAIKTIEVMLSADAEEYIKECNTKTHDLVHRDVIKPKLVDCTDFVNWLIEEVMDDERKGATMTNENDLIRRADAIEFINSGISLDTDADREYATEMLKNIPSAEAEPTVIRCKTLLNAEDFEAVATRIRKENRNVIVIPCETEVASADAVRREDYNETDGVIKIEKQSAKDVGEIKHIVIHSPNYTRYFYNESMPTSAEAVQGEWIDEDGNKVPLDKDGYPLGSCWCSQCHEWLVGSDEYAIKGNFCPNCGVRMYKGGENG